MNVSLENTDGGTRWWWLRHAPTGMPGLMVGSSDVPAAIPAKPVLHNVKSLLPDKALWLVSPMLRCRQTADALREDTIPGPRMMAEFVEQDFGAWEGKSYDQPEIRDAESFWQDPAGTAPPGGESFADMIMRVQSAINKIDYAGDVIVVAHAGVIRAAVALALNLAPDQALRLHVDPLSLTRIDRLPLSQAEVAWSVRSVNQAFVAVTADQP